uniref:Ribosomal RNA small subunit methyltransferase G n=1 Tax=Candidatus Kentrum sp. DK TaxID=2126562 RepID=A0A450T1W3_9GAMM|nr:MAG: 16S rRNA m(7)G-527 methyltransferase [Candidatus Kentron sp. DK]VFJ66249.1 MAG: 16S rRNA m(7)G-527 methyltransferase [Candidatus Kentron sp. DK]
MIRPPGNEAGAAVADNGAMLSCLTRGIEQLALSLDGQQRHALVRYVDLLLQWNRVYNLTSVRDPMEIARRHILDCLAVVPYLRGTRLLDLGTGAGLPGMILAITRPDVSCVLMDGNGKKTRFCLQAAMTLDLANVEIVHARVEKYVPEELFDTVTARAFGDLSVIWHHAGRLLKSGGQLLAMKGIAREDEASGEWAGATSRTTVSLTVPGLGAERHLVIVERR